MIVVVKPDYQAVGEEAARIIATAIRENPCIRLGLPTGSTPLGMYFQLVQEHRRGLDLSCVQTFNMDEYIGLPTDSPNSYRAYMFREFFSHVNVQAANIHIPDGNPPGGLDAESTAYEKAIKDSGGVDLQISGIGVNGHIGFNEPGSSVTSRTRSVVLAESTLAGMRRYFPPDDDLPRTAITIGVGTILEARRIVLMASGTRKADIVAKAIEGPLTVAVPASALQLHRDVTVILDEDAASKLRRFRGH